MLGYIFYVQGSIALLEKSQHHRTLPFLYSRTHVFPAVLPQATAVRFNRSEDPVEPPTSVHVNWIVRVELSTGVDSLDHG